MTATQLDFGLYPSRKKTATVIDRRTGLPVAALRPLQAAVLQAIVDLGSANAWEAQCWLRARGMHAPETNGFATRCNEMSSAGWVRLVGERPGSSGRQQGVYESTSEGRERLASWLSTEGCK